jgi:allophanate hydrolase
VALAALGREWAALADQPLGATGRRGAARPAALAPATEPVLPLAVVGAHLSGLPLNRQLTELGATLLAATRTAPVYRLFALPGTTPPKPGLLRVADGGVPIEAEVWALPQSGAGRLLSSIPAPLGLGRVELEDGSQVTGFLCEAAATAGAADISRHGGWRAYLSTL